MNPAQAYERFVVQNVFVPWTADLIERAIPASEERVLDLACGTGVVARTVAPLVGLRGKVAGLDISPEMLDVARSSSVPEGAAIEWHEGSGTDMPFANESFDLVLCQQGFQFFPDHAAGVREIRRVLAPKGRAVVSVWHGLDETPFMRALDEVISAHVSPGAFAQSYSLSDGGVLDRLAREAGFKDVDVQEARLTLDIQHPETFVIMMLQASSLVLPRFSELTPAERQSLVEQMDAELADLLQSFLRGEVLVIDTTANVLVARR